MRPVFFALLAALLPASAAATEVFDQVPAEARGQPSDLLLRVVRYDGSTNGAITVDVKNPSSRPQEFSARGIYFVPQVDPDHAPQRLGAVGPFSVHQGNTREARDKVTVAPGATQRLTLEVYCIDSHRSSPTSKTPFRLGKDRLPARLARAIEAAADDVLEGASALPARAAKDAIQSEVWMKRDARWIKLDGEGKQEASKSR